MPPSGFWESRDEDGGSSIGIVCDLEIHMTMFGFFNGGFLCMTTAISAYTFGVVAR